MDEHPPVCVIVFTHCRMEEREGYAITTIDSLNLLEYAGELRLHIADDDSEPDRFRRLLDYAGSVSWAGGNVTTTRGGGHGYGGSYNVASQVTHTLAERFLLLEDDWELMGHYGADFDLTPYVHYLDDERVGCLRMGYLGWTQELRGSLISVNDEPLLLLDPGSPEPHVFTGHPRLETLSFQRAVGPWPEDIAAGDTEWEVSHRMESRYRVAWPMHMGRSPWRHIGAVTINGRRGE